MASRSPIPWIQFAQSHCHLSENKWESEGRIGWKEKGEACDSTVLLSQWAARKRLATDILENRQNGGGKFPAVNERRDSEWQSERGTKATLSPQEGGNYSFSEQLLKQRVETGEEGRVIRTRDGLERNRAERETREPRSNRNECCETQHFESKWEKQAKPSPLTDVFFSFLMNNSRAERKDLLMSLHRLRFSYCSGQKKFKNTHKSKFWSPKCCTLHLNTHTPTTKHLRHRLIPLSHLQSSSSL